MENSLTVRRQGLPSITAQPNSNALEILRNPSTDVTENGVNALDLISSPSVSSASFAVAVAKLQANYGVEISEQKMGILFDAMREEGWTEYRFQETFKWFLKNKPYPAWTVADWFQYGVKVYPHSWMIREIQKGVSVSEIEIYLVGGDFVFRPKDGQTLPFPKVAWVKPLLMFCEACEANYDSERMEGKCDGGFHAPLRKLIYPMPVGVKPESV